jgi:hypothetical protein
VRRARLAPAMISTPGQRVLRRRQSRALPAWLRVGEPSRFSRQSRLHSFRRGSTGGPRSQAPVFRFQFGLPFVGPNCLDLDEIGPFLRVSFAKGRRVELGVAQSRNTRSSLIQQASESEHHIASLRNARWVNAERHPSSHAGVPAQRAAVQWASQRVRGSPSPTPQNAPSRSAETRSSDRERAGASSAADISLTAGS